MQASRGSPAFFRPAASLVALSVFLVCAIDSAQSDEVVLVHGGRIAGRVVEGAESNSGPVVIELASGGTVRFDRQQVAEVIVASPAEQQYVELAARMENTAQGHWQMAQWCQQHRLRRHYEAHLRHVIEHDPDHVQARQALGYQRQGDKWMRAGEGLEQQGFVRHRGSWLPQQDVAAAQAEEARQEALGEWRRQLRIWRRWLDTRRAAEAEAELARLDDPLAAEVISQLLENEKNPRVRMLYMDVLARFDFPSVPSIFARAALFDPDSDVRARAVRYLRDAKNPRIVPYIASALRHKDNQIVNRAGYILGQLDDPAAIPELIAALTTVHRYRLPETGSIGATLGRNPDGTPSVGGFSAGNRPKYVDREQRNESVHKALTSLSRVDFGYAKPAWWNWYARQRVPTSVNLRRSP